VRRKINRRAFGNLLTTGFCEAACRILAIGHLELIYEIIVKLNVRIGRSQLTNLCLLPCTKTMRSGSLSASINLNSRGGSIHIVNDDSMTAMAAVDFIEPDGNVIPDIGGPFTGTRVKVLPVQ